MNLTTGKWIPVVWANGLADKVSLLDVFQQGSEIQDLAVRPHERIALMRLLICIAQAALDGPKDREEWRRSRDRLSGAAVDYLRKWAHAFELFGDGQRFLQVEGVVSAKTDTNDDPPLASKMDTALATGNASTLFDNGGGSERAFEPARLSLMLLTFQCFGPGGLLSECLWRGTKTKKAGNVAAPCLAGKMIQTFLYDRESLRTSVYMNLLHREQVALFQAWGVPVWEKMPQGPTDATAIENASRTYLGRLVPACRAVRLAANGRSMIWGSLISYPNFADSQWRDPAATIFLRKQKDGEPVRTQLAGDVKRAVWRELHSISVLNKADQNGLGGPLALMNADDLEGVDIVSGAVVHEPMKTTNTVDVIESVLHVPRGMLGEVGQTRYSDGVNFAESCGRRLTAAVSLWHRALHDELERAEFRKRGNLVKHKAASHYWTAIEQKVPMLLALVEDPTPLRPEGAERDVWAATNWGKALAHAARDAYDLACPRGTPRQMKAYVLGLNVISRPIEVSAAEDESTNEEEA